MSPEVIALLSALSYAAVSISVRLGMTHSTPLTATCVALAVRSVTLWAAVFLTGGIPPVASLAVLLFVILGIMQSATSLLTFIGIAKIGAARNQPLRSSYLLWSAIIAITFLHEEMTVAVLVGTLLVVAGIILISRRPEEASSTYRWWDILFPLGASFLAGIAFPVRRYALIISNEPLFFAALLAVVALICLESCIFSGIIKQRLVWHREAALPLIAAGIFETVAALLSLTAVSIGPVVVVAPIVATSPLWTLVMTVAFLRGIERINLPTVIGTLSVVAGTIAIIVMD